MNERRYTVNDRLDVANFQLKQQRLYTTQLENALGMACQRLKDWAQTESQHSDYKTDPDWLLAERFELLMKNGEET